MDLLEIRGGQYFRHPWEIARSSAILSVIPDKRFEQIADIGAGDLYFLKRFIRRFPGNAFAVDPFYRNLDDMEGIKLLKSMEAIPHHSLDVVFLMDVLEHEEQDSELLAETCEKVKPGGLIVVTVPAHPYLFSYHDEYLKHLRRYGHAQLLGLAKRSEVEVIECFSFFTLPLFIRAIQVASSKFTRFRFTESGVGGWTLAESHFLTRLIASLLKIDFTVNRSMNRIGIPTFGLSICMLLKKKSA